MGEKDPTFEEAIYDKVAEELRRNELQPGLMAKAAAKAQGNPDLAKSLYIQFRAEQVKRDMDAAARQARAAAEESRRQSVLFAKAEANRKRVESRRQLMGRWLPRVGFAFGLLLVATIYWLGSGLSLVRPWPGLVNIPASKLIESFFWSAFLPPFVAAILWLPVWLWFAIRRKGSKHSPFLFVVIASLLLVLLELTGAVRVLSVVGFGQGSSRELNRWGPWDCLKTQTVEPGTAR